METIFGLAIPVTFILMLVAERLFPGRPQPEIRLWALTGFFFFVGCAALGGALPAALGIVLAKHAPVHLTMIPMPVAAVIVWLLGDFINYFVHRVMHNVPFLWRWTHQMHHAAERVDMWGANFIHPVDLVLQTAATTIPVILLGVTPEAALVAGYVGFLWGMVPHLNVKTPQWIGWFIQRPEAHAVHHARGVHAYNYGSVPLWDILFGTFRNPATFSGEPAGFWDGSSRPVGAMLLGRDVSKPPTETNREVELRAVF